MEEYEDDLEAMEVDQKNFNEALDELIDIVSTFKAKGNQDLTDVPTDDWANMIRVLDFSKFIMSGLMYSYGIPICGHDHSEDDDD